MEIRDPLYGKYSISKVASSLATTPEFRRLSQIRLINTLTPTLATLGEIRRYSHTLGVLYLASLWEKNANNFSEEELKAFHAAIVLHDIGTPPFGHLFEYILRDKLGWDHESEIKKILFGRHAPENIAHQFFAGRTIQVVKTLESLGVDVGLTEKILSHQHPLSSLIMGSLDFDNLDNVARMAWALGIKKAAEISKAVSTEINVDQSGQLLFPIKKKQLIVDWLDLRRKVYDILVFDSETVAAQAVLTKAISIGLDNKALAYDDWSLTDEELIFRLQKSQETKDLINQWYLGKLPKHIASIQVSLPISSMVISDKGDVVSLIEGLAKDMGVIRPLAYVFEDRGAFEKSLNFIDAGLEEEWCVGTKSSSTVIYLFSQTVSQSYSPKAGCLINMISETLGFTKNDISQLVMNNVNEENYRQGDFAF